MSKSGLELMAEYVFLSKYSQKKEDGNLESWNETVDRIYSMHEKKLKELGLWNPGTRHALDEARVLEYNRVILSSQRGRQFASTNPNSGILKHEAKLYNCCSTFIDRIPVFGELMYLLLCGCGVGYSLHKPYIDKLPIVQSHKYPTTEFLIPDSIEGWAEAVDKLMCGWFGGYKVHFDYSQIRPEGALIDGKFIAPGPMPLKRAFDKINEIFEHAVERKLTSIEIHDICCHIASAVVSGGVRRSAMIAMFDKDDELMLKAKTGSWWEQNPQRAFANNSILTSREEEVNYEDVKHALSVIRQFGEPGFVNVPNYQYVVNPCGEIVMKPQIMFSEPGSGKQVTETGFAFCNLVEINNKKIVDEEMFNQACKVAAFIATVQSLYTDFKCLGRASRMIANRDRAIGVSITGFYENNVLTPQMLANGAKLVAKTNNMWAARFGINGSKYCTTVKPSGNASCILGLTCSGIHPAHDHKYLRRIRIKTYSPEYVALKDTPMVKFLRGDEACITFPIESGDVVRTKDEVFAVQHLKDIAMVKHFWINKGSLSKTVSNNVSATVEVKETEWDEVAAVYYANHHLYTGVTFLPSYGDQVYDNAPFQRLSTPELQKEYDDIKAYIENNEIDFNEIMSNRDNLYSGDMAAQGCAGGACELK